MVHKSLLKAYISSICLQYVINIAHFLIKSNCLQLLYMSFFNQLKLIDMALNKLFKTTASSLAKVAALPVYRHPADLLNEFHHPYDLQRKQIDCQLPYNEGLYASQGHYQLSKKVAELRAQYRNTTDAEEKEKIAEKEFKVWNHYLNRSLTQSDVKLTEKQKTQVYEAILTAKERKEERLALCRFIKFGYEYSQAFKVDIPLNPIVIMRMVHPHFGYMNLIPNEEKFKYTHEQIFNLIEQFNVASKIRDTGCTLHSSEMVSFIFWKILTNQNVKGKLIPQASRVTIPKFLEIMKIVKFVDLNEENLRSTFSYSLKAGELPQDETKVRFDLFRQIFLDKDL